MDSVIGLGNAGCALADLFKQKYSSMYKVYKIDSECEGGYSLGYKPSPEEYEASVPDLGAFLHDIDDDILFVIGGGGQVSGAALRILYQLRHKNLNILYIAPELDQISNTNYLQHRLTLGVLQEYALSGLFQRVFLADNAQLANIIGDVPIVEYNNRINTLLVDAIHYNNIYSNVKPVLSTLGKRKDNSRICSLGLYDMASGTENMFFSLQNTEEKRYHFFINEAVLNTDAKLYKGIKETISRQEIRSSYQILTTQHPQNFCYIEGYTNQNQVLDNG